MSTLMNNTGESGFATLSKSFSRYVLFFGVLSVIIGLFIMFEPIGTVTTAAYFFGGILIFVGICQFVYAFNGYGSVLWRVVYALTGILSLFLGISAFISQNPLYAVYLLATYIGVVWLIRGFSSLFLAFQIKNSGLEVFNFLIGIVGIIAGIAMLYSPLFATLTLTFLVTYVGAVLAITGVCEIIGAIASLIKNRKKNDNVMMNTSSTINSNINNNINNDSRNNMDNFS